MTYRAIAAVIPARGAPFEMAEVDIDSPRPDEILVRLVASGICHTDILARDGIRPPTPPAILGHEGAGVIEVVGKGVDGLTPGDHVVLSFATCGRCGMCRRGRPAHCADFAKHNYAGTRPDGSPTARTTGGIPISAAFFGQSSFATRTVVRASQAVRVPPELDLRVLGPLGCAVQTGVGTVLNTLRPVRCESVVIFGAGSVGLSAAMGAVACGCPPIVIDTNHDRLQLARTLGASAVIAAGADDVVPLLLDMTSGGAAHIIDTTGRPEVMPEAIRALGVGGTYALVGAVAAGTTVPIDLQHLGRGRRIVGVVEGDSNPQQFIPSLVTQWQSRDLPFDSMITQYPMTEINRAVSDMLHGRIVKPVIVFPDQW